MALCPVGSECYRRPGRKGPDPGKVSGMSATQEAKIDDSEGESTQAKAIESTIKTALLLVSVFVSMFLVALDRTHA
jgi:hypothetical protein